ncbi:hypothetical protein ACWAT4_34540 [Bradyrhizobium manausense]
MTTLRAAAFSLILLAPTASLAGERVSLDRNPSIQARLDAQWQRYNPPSNTRSCTLREEIGPNGQKIMACR